jgi:acetyl-CoA C-acetyltransferase
VSDAIVVVGMARTPLGGLQGALADVSAADLGACAIKAAIERSQVPSDAIDETFMGCVLPAGQGQAPARQASLAAGIPMSTGCTTIK